METARFTIGTGYTHDGRKLENVAGRLETAKKLFVRVFGGYTAMPSQGGYIDKQGELVEESSVVLEAATDSTESELEETASFLCSLFEQESVLMTVSPAAVDFVEAVGD